MNTPFFRKEDIRDTFTISIATVNNWIKTGVIPAPVNGLYSESVFSNLVEDIKVHSERLRRRANRAFLNKSDTIFLGIERKERKELLIELVKRFEQSNLSIYEGVCALGKQILISNNLYNKNSLIYNQLETVLTNDFTFQNICIKNENDDILGAFYQSVQSMAKKANGGSYYTPPKVVKDITIPENATVLDPCCGSGGLLIHTLSKKHNPSLIFASDIDRIALLICRINLILFFENDTITPHIEEHDAMFPEANCSDSSKERIQYDFIIANPPWGSALSTVQKEFLLKEYTELGTTEAFSIILYNAMKALACQGQLLFFLPESILNVAAHKNIRQYILKSNRNIEITPLGMPFKGVQSECIMLRLFPQSGNESRIFVNAQKRHELEKRAIAAPDFFIPYSVSEQDEKILKQIFSTKHTVLSQNTKFSLGIVTGNNKKYLLSSKSEGSEPIFRGKDIYPYKLNEPEIFIVLEQNIFQQVAPIENYRTRKIVYRFISDKIICALDENGQLFLNSANILISEEYPMEILVCLFNSCIYSYIYQKKFTSKKVLKRHFLSFPLPVLTEEMGRILYDLYYAVTSGRKTQEDVDAVVSRYFNLTENDLQYIRSVVYGTTGKRI